MFGDENEQTAQADAVAELERLVALAPAELAVEILPAFGADGVRRAQNGIGALQVSLWLMEGYRRKPPLRPLLVPVQEAIQVLEHAGLVTRETIGEGGSRALVTSLGEQALSAGTTAARVEAVSAK